MNINKTCSAKIYPVFEEQMLPPLDPENHGTYTPPAIYKTRVQKPDDLSAKHPASEPENHDPNKGNY
jgi:hypothetical protein